MADVLLLGTIHFDQDMAERTRSALDSIRPKAITVEATSKQLQQHDQYQERVRRILMKRSKYRISQQTAEYILHQMHNVLYQEVHVAHEYANRHHLPFEHVDHPDITNILPSSPTVVQPEDIRIQFRNINVASARVDAAALYEEVATLLRSPEIAQHRVDKDRSQFLRIENDIRDAYAAKKILEIALQTQGTVVHICGCNHLLDDVKKETVYSILKESVLTTRKLLCEYQKR